MPTFFRATSFHLPFYYQPTSRTRIIRYYYIDANANIRTIYFHAHIWVYF